MLWWLYVTCANILLANYVPMGKVGHTEYFYLPNNLNQNPLWLLKPFVVSIATVDGLVLLGAKVSTATMMAIYFGFLWIIVALGLAIQCTSVGFRSPGLPTLSCCWSQTVNRISDLDRLIWNNRFMPQSIIDTRVFYALKWMVVQLEKEKYRLHYYSVWLFLSNTTLLDT